MDNTKKKKNRRLAIMLVIAALVMFGFGFALVPLYNVLCQVFGINGKTNQSAVENAMLIDKSRTITIQFLSHTNTKLPWEFYPKIQQIKVHPGENTRITYFAKNQTNRTMTVQAIPSVTPGLAAQYFKKTECFCFRQQTLKAHQSILMPVLFHIDNTVPKKIKEITLSYTLFKAPTQHKRTAQ